MDLNAFDRAWERLKARHRWLNAIDSKDWHTWIHHALITVVVGATVGSLSVAWAMRGMVLYYAVREVLNVRERQRFRMELKPLDHVMDVLCPLVACELVARVL